MDGAPVRLDFLDEIVTDFFFASVSFLKRNAEIIFADI